MSKHQQNSKINHSPMKTSTFAAHLHPLNDLSYKVTIHDTAAAGEETASLFLQVAAVATPGIVSDDQEAGGSTSHSGFQFS